MGDKPTPNPFPPRYALMMMTITGVARDHGYAIGLHGSMLRDLDLIAVPWRDDASAGVKLAEAIAIAVSGMRSMESASPGGRATYHILLDEHAYGKKVDGYIDLNVCDPRTATEARP